MYKNNFKVGDWVRFDFTRTRYEGKDTAYRVVAVFEREVTVDTVGKSTVFPRTFSTFQDYLLPCQVYNIVEE